MGTDIPIQEITNLVPKGKLGANAYTFMYTHHGYVLFHPNMKPMYHKIVSRVPFNWLRICKLSFSETMAMLSRISVFKTMCSFWIDTNFVWALSFVFYVKRKEKQLKVFVEFLKNDLIDIYVKKICTETQPENNFLSFFGHFSIGFGQKSYATIPIVRNFFFTLYNYVEMYRCWWCILW